MARASDNPFAIGTVVTGDEFADRADELRLLEDELPSGGRVFLLAYRRYGKSCLIHEALRRLEKNVGALTAYVDLYRASSEREFWELVINQLVAGSREPVTRVVDWLKSLGGALRPTFSVDQQSGMPTVTLGPLATSAELGRLRERALALPGEIAARRRRPVIVAFDEFQEIQEFDGGRLEKQMRAAFQQHRQVGYVFAGSKPHLLRRMADDPHAAFYRFGRRLELGPIPADAWLEYLKPRFGKGRIEIPADALRRVVELTEGVPYYVMRVCRLLWPRGLRRQSIDVNEVDAAFGEIVEEAGEIFVPTWEELTLAQRRTAAALAAARGNEIFGEAVRKEYELGAPSSAARSLERLRDLGLVGREGPTAAGARYRIVDPVFVAWVRRQRPRDQRVSDTRATPASQEEAPRPQRPRPRKRS
jgi:AAA+ ATPase superfamily predicted ATPase